MEDNKIPEYKDIGSAEIIPVTSKTQIRVRGQMIEDRKYIDIRSWYCRDSDPEFRPSKGLTIKLEKAEDVADAIKKVLASIE